MANEQEEVCPPYERRLAWQEESAKLHARIDEITGMLQDMRRILDVHVALDKDISPALKEIVIVWKGSKIMIPLLVTILTGLIASYAWIKDHIKP